MVRFWFISFQNLTVHKTPLVQGSLFILAVYAHEVPLCLCSVFCSRSQMRLSIARYRAFGARTTPRTVSRNLKSVNLRSRSECRCAHQASLIRGLHGDVGTTFLGDGERGGHRGWAFATYILGGVKCRYECWTQPTTADFEKLEYAVKSGPP